MEEVQFYTSKLRKELPKSRFHIYHRMYCDKNASICSHRFIDHFIGSASGLASLLLGRWRLKRQWLSAMILRTSNAAHNTANAILGIISNCDLTRYLGQLSTVAATGFKVLFLLLTFFASTPIYLPVDTLVGLNLMRRVSTKATGYYRSC
jgi:hypothetical protein